MTSNSVNCGIEISGRTIIHGVTPDGSRFKIHDSENQITNGMLLVCSDLITQLPNRSPDGSGGGWDRLPIHSLWVETSSQSLSSPTKSDTGPDSNSTVEYYYTYDKGSNSTPSPDIDFSVGGTEGLLEFNATIPKNEATGDPVRAIGLYTRGDNDDPSTYSLSSLDPSDPDTPTLVARQALSAIDKTGLQLDIAWRVQFNTV